MMFKDISQLQDHINQILANLDMPKNPRQKKKNLQRKKAPNNTDRNLIFNTRQNNKCNYCDMKYPSYFGVGDFDHIIPPYDYKGPDVNVLTNLPFAA